MNARTRAVLAFAVASLGFGSGFVAIKAGLENVPPLLFAAFRYDVGGAALVAYVARRTDATLPTTRADFAAVVVAAVFLSTLNGVLLFVGQRFVTAGTAAVVFSLVPVLAPVFALVVLPDTPFDPLGMVGLLLGVAGIAVVVGPRSLSAAGGAAVGVGLIAGAAASVAFGSVLVRRIDRTITGLGLTAWSLVLAAVALHALSLLAGESFESVTLARETVLVVAWVGLPATTLAFPAYYALIDTAGPVRANLISYTVPLVATVSGAVVLGEVIPARAVLGFAVVVLAFVVVERENLRRELRAARTRRAAGPPPPAEPSESGDVDGVRVASNGAASEADAGDTDDEEHPCECAPRG